MNELQTTVIVNLEGNLQARAARFADSIERMSTRGRKQLGLLDKAGNSVTGI